MKQAKYDGREVLYLSGNSGTVPRQAEVLQAQLAKIGVKVRIELADFPTFRRRWLQERQWDLVQVQWDADLDPDETLYPELHSTETWNAGKWVNKDFDRAVERRAAENDFKKRKKYYDDSVRAHPRGRARRHPAPRQRAEDPPQVREGLPDDSRGPDRHAPRLARQGVGGRRPSPCPLPLAGERAAGVPVGGVLIGVAQAENGRLVEGRPTTWKASGRPAAENPQGTLSAGRPSPLNGRVRREKRPCRVTSSCRGPTVAWASEGARLRNHRRHQDVHLGEHLRDERAGETGAQAERLQVVVGRYLHAQLEPRAHDRLDLVRPLAEQPRVDRRGLGTADDVRDVAHRLRIRHRPISATRAPSSRQHVRPPARTPAAISASTPWKK